MAKLNLATRKPADPVEFTTGTGASAGEDSVQSSLCTAEWIANHIPHLHAIRRECLDYIVVTGERHLRHILACYIDYYNAMRTHLSLGKDTPNGRAILLHGPIEVRPVLGGGLHHQYVRI